MNRRLDQFKRELPWLLIEGFSFGVSVALGLGLTLVVLSAVGVV